MVAVKPAIIHPVGDKKRCNQYAGPDLQIDFHTARLTASMMIGISLALVFSITSYKRENTHDLERVEQ